MRGPRRTAGKAPMPAHASPPPAPHPEAGGFISKPPNTPAVVGFSSLLPPPELLLLRAYE